MDITPMIDMTFLLLIFFIVTSRPTMENMIDLPKARYGSGVSERSSVIITMADQGANLPPAVYLGDGKAGQPLPDDPKLQEAEILRAVEAGFQQEGKSDVLLKAEKGIKHREVSRVAAAASQVEGIKLHLAVMEGS
ncbi:MAG: biopolymer transporter ExbD [Pirellulales bacterium]|nr:biopolymer transporter ExbD [Pirellulales bacterium]